MTVLPIVKVVVRLPCCHKKAEHNLGRFTVLRDERVFKRVLSLHICNLTKMNTK